MSRGRGEFMSVCCSLDGMGNGREGGLIRIDAPCDCHAESGLLDHESVCRLLLYCLCRLAHWYCAERTSHPSHLQCGLQSFTSRIPLAHLKLSIKSTNHRTPTFTNLISDDPVEKPSLRFQNTPVTTDFLPSLSGEAISIHPTNATKPTTLQGTRRSNHNHGPRNPNLKRLALPTPHSTFRLLLIIRNLDLNRTPVLPRAPRASASPTRRPTLQHPLARQTAQKRTHHLLCW